MKTVFYCLEYPEVTSKEEALYNFVLRKHVVDVNDDFYEDYRKFINSTLKDALTNKAILNKKNNESNYQIWKIEVNIEKIDN